VRRLYALGAHLATKSNYGVVVSTMSDRLLTTAEVGLPMPQRIATVTLSELRQLARLGRLTHMIWLILALYRVSPIILNEHMTVSMQATHFP
jgi:hypothetical protein